VSTDTFYAVVPFVRDERNELVALEPKSAPTRYTAFREASFSIGKTLGDVHIVGAVVFSRDRDDNGAFEDIVVLARYGETPTGD
jgi:hypothetical protein